MQDVTTAPSFRDPAGHVVFRDNRIFRVVNRVGEEHLGPFMATAAAGSLRQSGVLVGTERVHGDLLNLSTSVEDVSLYEHERIPFPSFPYEWPPEMLHAAGVLTIEIAEQCLDEGYGLKDASPYNVLFRGPDPVFVDVLSFERREPGDPTWLAYAQFTRNFYLPLLASNRLGIPLDQIFRSRRDGIRPDELYAWVGPLRRLLPPYLSAITIPSWLSRYESDRLYKPRSMAKEQCRFVLRSLLRRLKRTMAKLEPGEGRSHWSEYGNAPPSYNDEQAAAKRTFIETTLRRIAPRNLFDIGCNTGFYSMLAAENGASVVAADADPAVIGKLWRQARERRLDILPLVVDIARPTPALGWRYQESASFLDRARGGFDTVLMLALIHHLLVTERVPLEQIMGLAADLTTAHAIVEYIGPGDPMFRRLTRGRDHLHADLTPERFEDACLEHFDIVERAPLPACLRTLYLLRKH